MISKLINAQKAFFLTGETKSLVFRKKMLLRLKSELIKNEQNIIDALYADFKKPVFESVLSETGLVLSELDLTIKKLNSWAKTKRVFPSLLNFPSTDKIYYEPYGTVLVLAPWNYPFHLCLFPVIGAIAAGNTVVLKPSELTPNTSKIVEKIIKTVFEETLVAVIQGDASVAQELLKEQWDYIFFTGSTHVGKIVAQAAAKHLTPVVLELGGKSPCIIDDSVNLKLVARRLVWGKLLNGGQTCIAPDYVIAKSNIKEDLIAVLKTEINKQYGENPENSLDFPRIVNKNNTKRLETLLQDSNIVFGGKINVNECYISPTLVDQPSLNSQLMQEEIFGPILPILTYNTEEDIEHIIWNLEKPLSLYVFSNKTSFIKSTIEKYSFGGGVINDLLIHFGNHRLPFGGVGASGMGKYHGKHGFNTFSNTKPIVKRGNWFDPSFRYAPYKGKMSLLKLVFKYFG